MIKIDKIKKQFPLEKDFFGRVKKYVTALNDISIEFPENKITGIVGESGSGKSTLARVLCGIYRPDNGNFSWNELNSRSMNSAKWKKYRRNVQMVFQDPYSSLNPRMKIMNILKEPLIIHTPDDKNNFEKIINESLVNVGLSIDSINKYPHEFSGGQRQRIAIARALILRPEVILFDEAVSALDVSIQAQILNLVLDIQKELHTTCIFIAHDLSVVSYVSDAIAVMYGGRIVEFNKTSEVFSKPRHPYTRLLLDSIPRVGIKKINVEGKIDTNIFINPAGCPFYYRCPRKLNECEKTYPNRTVLNEGFYYECFNPENIER